LAVLMLSIGLVATAAAARRSGEFPALLYPPPVAAVPDHALALCPNHRGLEPFTSNAMKLALRMAARYDRRNLETDLHNSDRAWWPDVRRMWRTRRPGSDIRNGIVLGSEPTARIGFDVFMGPACATTTLKKSFTVTIGPNQTGAGMHRNACNSHLFFIDRRGRPLIYFLY
jgi:hypothetical protein